jgi:PTH1 family peptidyl-tRNA hydrolase
MKLLVGLGNPGPKYELTRHNAGFLVLDVLASDSKAKWAMDQKLHGEVCRGAVLGEPCILLKPMTFMNSSGRSVGSVMRFYKIRPEDVVVFHDDIDVPAGKVRARTGGGHGGHNGIRSIISETGVSDFHRIKLGLGRPPEQWDTADWVLQSLTDGELQVLRSDMLNDVYLRLKQIFGSRDSSPS